MKILFYLLVFSVAAFFCPTTQAQSGGGFNLSWSTIDGGGGISTGGVYSVAGTIGQPDAGATMSGGNFALVGGFWSIIAAIQTPGAPYLSITNLGNRVVVSWPAPADGWLLERTNVLASVPGSWAQMSPPYQTNNGVISATFTNAPPMTSQFFRLRK